ncbi:MAG TPA: DUF4349 domain-containing protein, partial [Armatimonadota bacterium]|nr:DUF4349 domain-containing protein [Armatimonadota bacterium]
VVVALMTVFSPDGGMVFLGQKGEGMATDEARPLSRPYAGPAGPAGAASKSAQMKSMMGRRAAADAEAADATDHLGRRRADEMAKMAPSTGSPLAAPGAMAGAAPQSYREPSLQDQPMPWYDTSGGRQQELTRTLEVEVRKVEEAHDRAVSLVEKSGGFVLSQDLRVEEGEPGVSRITARVPLDRIDGVVAQLRDMGKTLKLVGESEDRTREYYGRGGGIRQSGASEDELVRQYEKATDPEQKRQLKAQIDALRQMTDAQKEQLLQMEERVRFALLDLTLLEERGPMRFLGRVGENALKLLSWVLVSSVIWVPALVVVWVVRRRYGRHPAPPG